MRKTKVGLLAALLTLAMVSPAAAKRDSPRVGMAFEYSGATLSPLSIDGPRNSNALLFDATGGFARGYWDMPVATSSWGFSYLEATDLNKGDGAPRISVVLDDTWTNVIYLDPFHCPGTTSLSGWVTTDFHRLGSDCTIHTSWGESYTGDDVVSAWTKATTVADKSLGKSVYLGFFVVDTAEPILADRFIFGGNVFSKFTALPAP
jgi:hypothetical protein